MSKKSKAFELFDQGLRPSSPEVKALGLKPKSVYNYYQLWKHTGEVIESKAKEDESVEKQSSQLVNGLNIKNYATFIKFHPIGIDCSLTPIIMIGKELSHIEFNWPKDLPWEDFFDAVIKTFFQDRGIHLLPYYYEGAESEE